jgi:hypothetical protein
MLIPMVIEETTRGERAYDIAAGIKRVQRTQIGWNREVFEFDCPLQMFSQALQRGDAPEWLIGTGPIGFCRHPSTS